MPTKKILWVDDEIELLKSHVIFLTEKGYEVETVTNGEDAIDEVKNSNYDLIFLDEMMPGMGGLETLAEIKEINPHIPVVMVTKSEEESLMHDAIGGKISDYLIKPVVPSQILLVCKKIFDAQKISGEYVARDYLQDFNQISRRLLENPDYDDWIDIYKTLVNYELELDAHPEIDLRQTLVDQKKECNQEFSKYIERHYKKWINDLENSDHPELTPKIIENHVLPRVENSNGPVFLFVLDCLRLDQWKVMERHLLNLFNIKTNYYYSILPTATPYARNSFSSNIFVVNTSRSCLCSGSFEKT